MTSEEAMIPTQFTHSIKLEETAKGVRFSIHVYANDRAEALKELFVTYRTAKDIAQNDKIPLAPMEVTEKK